jgi:cytochrome c oxidase subunit IV
MAEHHSEALYHKIFWYLLALTILEVIVALLPLPTLVKGILLVGMALGKAGLVAMYFMHLRFERLSLAVIAFTPLVICVFLVFMLTPDLSSPNRIYHKAVGIPAAGAKH